MPDERPDALPTFDVALLGQIGQRSPHGDPGHPELVAQRLLSRQRVTGSDSAAGNLVVQHQEELAMQRHPGAGSHPAAGLLGSINAVTPGRLPSRQKLL